MANIVTFDPIALLIVEINVGSPAQNVLSVLEIYSEWKDWLRTNPSRLGHPQAFSVVGGDPTIGTQSLGSTFFLENGWRLRPAEYSHKLALSGNIFPRGGGSIFVPTVGAFNVHTETLVSNIIDKVQSGSGLDMTQNEMLLTLYRLAGLDPTKPLVVTNNTRSAGAGISQTIVQALGSVTVTRT